MTVSTCEELRSQIKKFSPLLKDIYAWLYENCGDEEARSTALKVAEVAYRTLGVRDIDLYRLFLVIGLSTNCSTSVADLLDYLKSSYPNRDKAEDFLKSDVWELIRWVADDSEEDNGNTGHSYYPWGLLFASAYLGVFARDLIKQALCI